MNEIQIKNLNELESFAKSFAKDLQPGSVVCLTGDLGAGKTAFVQAVAKAFGIEEPVQSPTFNILLQYKNDEVQLNHFDLYRLEKPEELEDIGFYECIEGEAINFIEWAEKFKDQMPEDAIWITIKKLDETTRNFIVKL